MSKANHAQDIHYRKLSSSDIEIYHEIRYTCLKEHPNSFGTTYEEEIKKEYLKFDKYLMSGDMHNFVLAAFKDDSCIGICGFIKEEGKRRKHRGHLVQIYVRKQYQGKGIGKEMISRTISEAFNRTEVEQILLGVVSENDQAIQLYETLGFKEYGMIKEYLKLEDRYLGNRMMIKYKEK